MGEGIYGAPGEFALLDGGATNALRKARPEEMQKLVPTTVELAHGTTTLYRVPGHQTLLSTSEVEPIIPLGWLVQGGYHIDWSKDRCVIQHPERGPLACELRAGCPVMDRALGLELLDDLEKGRVGTKAAVHGKAAQCQWWTHHFPDLPPRLLQWIDGQDQPWKSVGMLPWNRHKRRRLWKSRGVISIYLRVKTIDLGTLGARKGMKSCAWTSRREVTCITLQCGLSCGSLLQAID